MLANKLICYSTLYSKTFGLTHPVLGRRDNRNLKIQINVTLTFELAIFANRCSYDAAFEKGEK